MESLRGSKTQNSFLRGGKQLFSEVWNNQPKLRIRKGPRAFATGRGRCFQISIKIRYLGFVGFLLGIGALNEFRKARTTLDPHGSVKNLVTSGIYRFTRNPIYLGFLLMVIGVPLNFGLYWGIGMVPFYIILMNRLIIEREENYLEKKFKNAYTNYKSQVRRWL